MKDLEKKATDLKKLVGDAIAENCQHTIGKPLDEDARCEAKKAVEVLCKGLPQRSFQAGKVLVKTDGTVEIAVKLSESGTEDGGEA